MKDADRSVRVAIVEQSEVLFRERLYSHVSTSEIASALGISKKTLYKYFSSKEEILRIIIEKTSEIINRQLDSIYENDRLSFVERVLDCLDALKFMHAQVSPAPLMHDIQRHATHAWQDVRKSMSGRVSVVAQFLLNGKKEGAVRDDVAENLAALLYMSTTAGIMDEQKHRGITMSSDQLFACFTQLFYSGMFSDEARVALEKTREEGHQLPLIPTATERMATENKEPGLSDHIRTVSRDLFFRYGFSKVRMDEIASELHISKKTLYNHFSGKEDVLMAVLNAFREDIILAHRSVDTTSCTSFVDSMRSFVMYMAKMLGEITPQFVRDLMRSAPHLFEQLYAWRQSAIDDTFISLLAEGQRIGAIRSDFSARDLAQTYRIVADSTFSPEVLNMTAVRPIDVYKTLVNAMFVGVLHDKARAEFRTRCTALRGASTHGTRGTTKTKKES